MNKIITNSPEETQQAGFDLAKALQDGDVILLYGDLGYGKTTFVQGLAKGLGVLQRIISPTFIIVRKYDIKMKNQKSNLKNKETKRLYHIDLYRVKTVHDIEGLGIKEIFQDSKAVVVIEWPEKMFGLELPEDIKKVTFEYLTENRRRITISQ